MSNTNTKTKTSAEECICVPSCAEMGVDGCGGICDWCDAEFILAHPGNEEEE